MWPASPPGGGGPRPTRCRYSVNLLSSMMRPPRPRQRQAARRRARLPEQAAKTRMDMTVALLGTRPVPSPPQRRITGPLCVRSVPFDALADSLAQGPSHVGASGRTAALKQKRPSVPLALPVRGFVCGDAGNGQAELRRHTCPPLRHGPQGPGAFVAKTLHGTSAVKPGFRLQVFAGIPASPLAVPVSGRVSLLRSHRTATPPAYSAAARIGLPRSFGKQRARLRRLSLARCLLGFGSISPPGTGLRVQRAAPDRRPSDSFASEARMRRGLRKAKFCCS
jgi:hypothetical protein